MPLEEIAKLFDGEEANVGGSAATGQALDHLRDMKVRGLADDPEMQVEQLEGTQVYQETEARKTG